MRIPDANSHASGAQKAPGPRSTTPAASTSTLAPARRAHNRCRRRAAPPEHDLLGRTGPGVPPPASGWRRRVRTCSQPPTAAGDSGAEAALDVGKSPTHAMPVSSKWAEHAAERDSAMILAPGPEAVAHAARSTHNDPRPVAPRSRWNACPAPIERKTDPLPGQLEPMP